MKPILIHSEEGVKPVTPKLTWIERGRTWHVVDKPHKMKHGTGTTVWSSTVVVEHNTGMQLPIHLNKGMKPEAIKSEVSNFLKLGAVAEIENELNKHHQINQ